MRKTFPPDPFVLLARLAVGPGRIRPNIILLDVGGGEGHAGVGVLGGVEVPAHGVAGEMVMKNMRLISGMCRIPLCLSPGRRAVWWLRKD